MTTTEHGSKKRPLCFVVMPFGRDPEEQKWFRGWYEVVLSPAILATGYEPVLSAGEEQPGAINDEIRAHLAYDPMVLVDLGGFERADEPNPNVMYELGIRHALGLPVVIMAWDGQRLPFDVSNQRVIMQDRAFLDIEVNKRKIIAFIQAAAEGKYYKPMDAVGRMATIAAASESLGKDDLLSALVQEVQDLKGSVKAAVTSRPEIEWESTLPLRTIWRQKELRKNLFAFFEGLGGTSKTWNFVLKKRLSVEFARAAERWTEEEWQNFVRSEFLAMSTSSPKPQQPQQVGTSHAAAAPAQTVPPIDDELIEHVRSILPAQPWPKDTHKMVTERLQITNSQYKRAVDALISRGIVHRQVNGTLLDLNGNVVISPRSTSEAA